MDVAIADENGLVEQGRQVDGVEGRRFVGDQVIDLFGLRRLALLILRRGREDAAHRFLVLGIDLVLEKLL